jgi:bifunctional non-homologous end joining protein LigD
VRAYSRNGNEITRTYPELAECGELLAGRRAVLDGEVVALEHERPSFALLQQRMHVTIPSASLLQSVPVLYYAFDLLCLDGRDLTGEPYATRRDMLAQLALVGEHVKVPVHFVDVDGQAVLQAAEIAGLEGVVAKRLASPYRPGKRSADWTKTASVGETGCSVVENRRPEPRRHATCRALHVWRTRCHAAPMRRRPGRLCHSRDDR